VCGKHAPQDIVCRAKAAAKTAKAAKDASVHPWTGGTDPNGTKIKKLQEQLRKAQQEARELKEATNSASDKAESEPDADAAGALRKELKQLEDTLATFKKVCASSPVAAQLESRIEVVKEQLRQARTPESQHAYVSKKLVGAKKALERAKEAEAKQQEDIVEATKKLAELQAETKAKQVEVQALEKEFQKTALSSVGHEAVIPCMELAEEYLAGERGQLIRDMVKTPVFGEFVNLLQLQADARRKAAEAKSKEPASVSTSPPEALAVQQVPAADVLDPDMEIDATALADMWGDDEMGGLRTAANAGKQEVSEWIVAQLPKLHKKALKKAATARHPVATASAGAAVSSG